MAGSDKTRREGKGFRLLAGWRRRKPQLALPAPEPRPAGLVSSTEEPVDRLSLAQWIWGQGCLLPGGADQLLGLVASVRIKPNFRVLDLTAGLGGPSRALAKAFKVYVTPLESDAATARRGRAQSVELGLGRQVPVGDYNPDSLELREGAFDLALAQYLTAPIEDKERLLREIRRGLRTGGHLVFVDFVLRQGAKTDPRLVPLLRGGIGAPSLWRSEQYVDCLAAAGFDCRIAEDHSAGLRGQVLSAWERLSDRVDLKVLPKLEREVLGTEFEPWLERISLIDAGLVGVVRFDAVAV